MPAELSLPALKKVATTFGEDGTIEYSVTYIYRGEVPQPAPGSKGRTTRATRMAAAGLGRDLEGLGKGVPLWGGFATNTRESTDHVIVEREEQSS